MHAPTVETTFYVGDGVNGTLYSTVSLTSKGVGETYDSAREAAEVLSEVHPNASCYPDAVALSKEIAGRVKELDDREWQFILDEQSHEHEMQKAEIDASKEIARVWAENQPDLVYNVYWW